MTDGEAVLELMATLRKISDMGCAKLLPPRMTCRTMHRQWQRWTRQQWCPACLAADALDGVAA